MTLHTACQHAIPQPRKSKPASLTTGGKMLFKQSFRKSYNRTHRAEDNVFLCALSAVFPTHVVLRCRFVRWDGMSDKQVVCTLPEPSSSSARETCWNPRYKKQETRFLNRCKLVCLHGVVGAMLIYASWEICFAVCWNR